MITQYEDREEGELFLKLGATHEGTGVCLWVTCVLHVFIFVHPQR